MENLSSLKDRIKDRILKQTKLEEFYRDPLGYCFIYWKLSTNSINLEINKDIKRSIQNWLDEFLNNIQINDFIDRNATGVHFIHRYLLHEIQIEETDLMKNFPILKHNYDTSSCLFFKNLLYTVIIIDSLNKISIQDIELVSLLKRANEKINSFVDKDIVFNDPKIFPFLCEYYGTETRKRFIEFIKNQAELNKDNIVDQDRIYYAWAILKYRDYIDKAKLSSVNEFVSSAVSVVRSLLESLSDETLEHIYGKNVRDSLPFYWLGFAYELVTDYELFLNTLSSDFDARAIHLLKQYNLESILTNYSIAKERVQMAALSSDDTEKIKLSTEAGYYLGLVLEGTLKFICHKIAVEVCPNDKYSTFNQAIEDALKKLKDKKYKFIIHDEPIDKEINDLKDKFRNIADHFKVDKGVLVKEGKFKPKQISLEEVRICLSKSQLVVSMLLERLSDRTKEKDIEKLLNTSNF